MMQSCDTAPAQHAAHNRPQYREDFTEEGCKLNIGFIGAGKAGMSLGKYFAVRQQDALQNERGSHAAAANADADSTASAAADSSINAAQTTVKGYYSRSSESAKDAARFTNSNAYDTMPGILSECDMIFLTVPDGNIKAVWKELSRYNVTGKLICHCSGAMSSREAFAGIEETGAYGYSIHPLFAVSDKYEAYRELTDVFFTLEGSADAEDDPHLEEIKAWLESLGNPVGTIRPEDKTRYHCAAAVASNLVCGLVDFSMELLQTCGFSEENALMALRPILKGNMAHIASDGPEKSLTGPVERNDEGTIQKHLQCLETAEDRQLYRLLSRRITGLAQHRHPERDYTEIRRLLRKDGSK